MGTVALIVPLFFYLAINAAVSALIKQKFGRTLPVVLCGSGLILYKSQLFLHSFSYGFYLLLAMAVLSVPLLFMLVRGRPEKLHLALTPGTIAFVVLYLFACAILIGKHFNDWDEFSHWGMMIKESLRLDRFHCVTESRMKWHKDYPPFEAMIALIWCKLCGGYSEPCVTIAMQVLTLSFILPTLLEKMWQVVGDQPLGKSNWYIALVQAAALEVIVLMFDLSMDVWSQRIINSILPDTMLSFAFAYLVLILLDEPFDWFSAFALAIVGSAVLSIKQVGIAFYMVVVFMALLNRLIPKESLQRNDGKSLVKLIVIVLIPAAVFISWSAYKGRYISDTDYSYMYGQFNLRQIDLAEYIRALQGKGSGIRSETALNYLEALFTRQLNNVDILPMTYVSSLVIFAVALIAMRKLFREQFSHRKAVLLGAGFTVGTIGYALMLSVLYLFCFPDNEKERLAGFSRYMNSYMAGEMLVLLALFLVLALMKYGDKLGMGHRRNATKVYIVAALLAMILFNPSNIYHLVNRQVDKRGFQSYEEHGDRVREAVPADSKVFIICDKERTKHKSWWSPMQLFVQYFASDVDIDFRYNNAYAWNYKKKGKKQTIVDEISSCDYLYVAHTCDNVNAAFSEFIDGDALIEGGIYRVEDEGKKMHLRLVENAS